MKINSVVVVLLVGVCAQGIASLELPYYIKPCAISDPKLHECEKLNGNEAIPQLAQGDPEYNIPVLDPLTLPDVQLGDSSVSIVISNIVVRGFSKTKIISRTHDVYQRRIYTEFVAPVVTVNSEYVIGGYFLNIPLSGRGYSNVTLENLKTENILDYVLEQKPDGKTYITPIDSNTSFDITGGQVYLSDLFNGDKELGDRAIQHLNENFRLAFQQVAPSLGKITGDTLLDAIKRLYNLVPFDNLYTL